ncbi:hypothetical protein GEV43_32680 [Actinomadura sp. J1-007]|uniref:hypothetical protein n=1 Tax=Actinomadura sp. J1-007 TaxID=2661913 RepID=UPI001327FB30|nr:hypothetical protein [Actinomadura sp. J1-007]MWK38330.1 hypothetical protein [Actinomadura sp. J1-007]
MLAAAATAGAGGAAKASWKLIVAVNGPDLTWLSDALFPLLLIGFALLARSLFPEPDGPRRGVAAYALAALPVVGLTASAALRDTWPAMLLAILAVSTAAVRLALLARAAGDTTASALFGLWMTGQYVLGPLAARPDQSVPLQWVEQGCNTLTQTAFAYAAWRLARTVRTKEPVAT